MTDLAYASGKRLALLLRRRRIGSVELLDHYIERITRLDGALNAVVVRDFDRARDTARTLDRAKAPVGPLHGVCMTVKESFDVAGLPTTWGMPEAKENVARADALAVERLKAAGAVIMGKTNVPRALADWQSHNEIHGATVNPWDVSRTPGGSSGGAAAALAAGLTGLETGSDIGGSIRVPAHFCGVFGHKPTYGLCPMRGHSILPVEAPTDISVIGPLGRSAEDLGFALDVIGGPDTAETGMSYRLPSPRVMTPDGLRVAVWTENPLVPTDAATAAMIRALALDLKRDGARVGLTARPSFDPREAFHTYLRLLHVAMTARLPETVRQEQMKQARALPSGDESATAIMLRAVGISHVEWLRINETRMVIRRAWGEFFRDWDVLLCPVFATPAFPRVEEGSVWERTIPVNGAPVQYNELLFWPGIGGGYHLPASVAPIGTTEAGLPVGVQIVGPLFGDRMTIAVAAMIERLRGGFLEPPGWA